MCPSRTGCALKIVFFEDFKIYSGIWPLSVSTRCQCVYTMAGQTPALQQNLQSSEKFQHLRKTQYLMNTLYLVLAICLSIYVSFPGLSTAVQQGPGPIYIYISIYRPIYICQVNLLLLWLWPVQQGPGPCLLADGHIHRWEGRCLIQIDLAFRLIK